MRGACFASPCVPVFFLPVLLDGIFCKLAGRFRPAGGHDVLPARWPPQWPESGPDVPPCPSPNLPPAPARAARSHPFLAVLVRGRKRGAGFRSAGPLHPLHLGWPALVLFPHRCRGPGLHPLRQAWAVSEFRRSLPGRRFVNRPPDGRLVCPLKEGNGRLGFNLPALYHVA